jgi:environmental stress-induced protein Ves
VQPLIVRSADVPARPWKNGGGITRELLALPEGDGWRVRVSVAEVASDGPFSTFAGADRWFAVLEGAGVELTVDGSARRVTPVDDALAFSGAAETRCRLLDGPTRDLNLMLRGVAGALARVMPGATWRPDARACGVYASVAGACRTSGADDATAIPADALCWWREAPAALAFDGSGWWLRADTSDGATCDCADYTFRHDGHDQTGCKHVRVLRALGLIDPAAEDASEWPA